MPNERRKKTREKLGIDKEKKKKEEESELNKAFRESKKITQRRKEIESNGLYKILIKNAVAFDVAEGLLGFIEILGDVVTSLLNFSYVVMSLFVVRSLRLSLAVFVISTIDAVIGFFPIIGSVLDLAFFSNTINRSLIKGFVEGDYKKIQIVNILSMVSLVAVLALGVCIYWIVQNIGESLQYMFNV